MRKSRFVGVAVIAALALAACAGPGNDEGDGTTAEPAALRIAYFSPLTNNSFLDAIHIGVEAEAASNGADLATFDANADINTQVSQIKTAISSGEFDALAIVPLNGAGVVPVVREAVDAGLLVVCIYTACGADPNGTEVQIEGLVAQIGINFVEQGESLGASVVEACSGISPCHVAYIPGLLTTSIDTYRQEGFHKAVDGHKNIVLVATDQAGESKVDVARQVAQTLMVAHPEIDVIAAAGDQMASGVQLAVGDQAGKKVKIIGLGGSEVGVKAVKSGVWFATAGPSLPTTEGKTAISLLVEAFSDSEKRNQLILDSSFPGNLKFVDSSNVSQFVAEWNGS